MVSNIVNYWRGEVSDCPISAGGGDRPNPKKGAQSQKPIIEEDIEEDIEEGFLGPEDGEVRSCEDEAQRGAKRRAENTASSDSRDFTQRF